jgi:hydrogenase nickel incorporation protein HypA/HybF
MHEFSLMNSLMNQIYAVASENKAKRIVSLKIRLGALSHMSPEHFREHFEEAAKGGIAENARLNVEVDTDQTSLIAQEILIEIVDVES